MIDVTPTMASPLQLNSHKLLATLRAQCTNLTCRDTHTHTPTDTHRHTDTQTHTHTHTSDTSSKNAVTLTSTEERSGRSKFRQCQHSRRHDGHNKACYYKDLWILIPNDHFHYPQCAHWWSLSCLRVALARRQYIAAFFAQRQGSCHHMCTHNHNNHNTTTNYHTNSAFSIVQRTDPTMPQHCYPPWPL